MEIVDPTQIPSWDEILLRTPGHSFFHSSSWAKVLKGSYGYVPQYIVEIKDGRFLTLIPLMEVNSFLTGKRGVSLPFTDSVEPIIQDKSFFQELFNHIVAIGKRRRWKYIELRGGGEPCPKVPALIAYIGHSLELVGKEEEIFSNFRGSTRRNIKKAISEGVRVVIHHDWDGIKEFFRLNRMTRKMHGLPPQPFSFFRNFYNFVISPKEGFVALALHRNRPIAGAVYCHFGEKAIFKYGASDAKYLHLRANNLVMWEGIRRSRQEGCRSFCFGRTDPDNRGLERYKMGWGAKEQTLPYFRYDLRKNEFTTRQSRKYLWGKKIFQKAPIPALDLAGSLLYRHMG